MRPFDRSMVRKLFTAAAVVFTAPLWILVRALGQIGDADGLLLGCSQLLSLVPGRAGVYVRRGFHSMALECCAGDVHIEFATWFSHCRVHIDRGVYIGGRCTIGMVDIGENALIGSNVDIPSGRRQHYFSSDDRPVASQG